MHSICPCSLPVWRRSFLKKGTPVTFFCPALDLPMGGSGQKTTTLVRDYEYFMHTKFHQNPSSGSGKEVENVKVYGRRRTTDGRTDRRTTDGALWQWLTLAFGSGELKTGLKRQRNFYVLSNRSILGILCLLKLEQDDGINLLKCIIYSLCKQVYSTCIIIFHTSVNLFMGLYMYIYLQQRSKTCGSEFSVRLDLTYHPSINTLVLHACKHIIKDT